ncbi:MAG: hypothetical protein ACOZNI_03955 [Myxococcota bacterium]
MMRLLPLAVLLACSSGSADHTEEYLADFDVHVEEVRTLVADHAAAVAAATTLEDVGALEDQYLADWQALYGEMGELMDAMMDECEMDDMASMDDADAGMMDMDAAVMDHVDAHATHADVAECAPEETTHGEEMGMHADDMAGYGDGWHDTMHCGDGGGHEM